MNRLKSFITHLNLKTKPFKKFAGIYNFEYVSILLSSFYIFIFQAILYTDIFRLNLGTTMVILY